MEKFKLYFIFSLIFTASSPSWSAVISYDISGFYSETYNSNILGLAVNPENNEIFFSSLSYRGGDNFWRLNSSGELIDSSRVDYDYGTAGNLGELVFGIGGSLFASATYYDVSTRTVTHSLLELTTDGSVVSNSSMSNTAGLTYNTDESSLMALSGVFGSGAHPEETVLISNDGLISSYFSLVDDRYPYDLAYNAINSNLYTVLGGILNEYTLDTSGYDLINQFDLTLLPGVSGASLAIDINQATGRFYIQNNNRRIVSFERSDLTVYVEPDDPVITVPEPPVLALIVAGIVGLGFLPRNASSNLKFH
ncbi:hypothetical protein [Methylotuvimicrobium sp.]|uniref:hypothetical protein n=1 Tax=Methylotuvimicrobium sp. TaxID=2822413 RepID=UPI003D64B6F7